MDWLNWTPEFDKEDKRKKRDKRNEMNRENYVSAKKCGHNKGYNFKLREDANRLRYGSGLSYGKIGKLLGVSRSRIHSIIKGYHSNSLVWGDIREKIFIRDGRKCKLEIANKCSERLIVHHINGDNRDNNPNNLITVCVTCHPMLHLTKKIANITG